MRREMKTHEELLKENRVIYQMIAEHCNEDRTANAYWSDWRRCTDQKMAGDVLRKILTGMMIAENECTEANAAETIDRLVVERLEKRARKRSTRPISLKTNAESKRVFTI